MDEITLKPIGYVNNDVQEKKDVSWGEDVSYILLAIEAHQDKGGLRVK